MVKINVAGVITACVPVLAAAVFAAVISPADAATAENTSPLAALAGTYMQNVACKGNAKDEAALKVTISAQEIISNIGICKVLSSAQDSKSVKAHVECKFPAGPLIGDITFTPRPDKTIKFIDRDNTYNAVLHPCPN